MAISLKHAFTSAKSDGGDATLVRPSNWNAEHNLTLATDKLLGRSTAGTGAVEEISCTAAGRALLDDAAASDQRTTLGLGALATLSTVDTAQIEDDAVTTAKILDSNVTTAKIADSNVTTAKIADGDVTFAKLDTAAVATQAEIEAETAEKLLTAALAKYLPGMAKAWGKFAGASGTLSASHNVTSVNRDSLGDYTVTLDVNMSSSNYAILITVLDSAQTFARVISQSAGSFSIKTTDATSDQDATQIFFACYGDQA